MNYMCHGSGLVPPLLLEMCCQIVHLSSVQSTSLSNQILHAETESCTPSDSAANDFWSQTYRKALNQQQMTQELSVLMGCSAGVSESFVVCPISPFVILLLFRRHF